MTRSDKPPGGIILDLAPISVQPSALSVVLQTRRGSPIPNALTVTIDPGQLRVEEAQLRTRVETQRGIKRLTGPSETYNCHGLVFASRRTNIPPVGTDVPVRQILAEDSYQQVLTPQVGDVAVYVSEREVDHTGLVIQVDPNPALISGIWIWSMWGGLGEFVHPVNFSPYSAQNIEHWRINTNAAPTISL